MKMLRTIRRLSVAILVFVQIGLVGCSVQVQPKPTEQLSPIPGSQIGIVLSETQITTPTSVPGLSPTMAVTLTSVPTVTPTSQATLEPTQFAETFEKFLSQGNDCLSPCIFGITPGQTTINQAQDIFDWLRSPLSTNTYPSGKEFYSTLLGYDGNEISISVDLTEENGVVKNIDTGITLPKYKKVPDPRAWQAFSPSVFLQKYGNPTYVGFNLTFPSEEGFPLKTAWYNMVLEYKNLDLTIQYFRGWTLEDNLIKICPMTDQYDSVSVDLGKDLEYSPPPGVPLEKTTSLTLEQFSDLLKQKPESACFKISKEAFFSTK